MYVELGLIFGSLYPHITQVQPGRVTLQEILVSAVMVLLILTFIEGLAGGFTQSVLGNSRGHLLRGTLRVFVCM